MPAKSWKDLMNDAEKGAKEFEMVAPGMYPFVIKEAAEIGQTSKENPKFTVKATIESGDRANAVVFHQFIVSDSPYAMKNFFFGDLAVLGLGTEFFNQNPSEQQIAQALLGKRFTAEVYHEEANNGKTYARLRNFSTPTSAAPSAGVPGGLPSAAPVAASTPAPLPQAAAAPVTESPWATAPLPTAAPAPQGTNAVPLPPAFG